MSIGPQGRFLLSRSNAEASFPSVLIYGLKYVLRNLVVLGKRLKSDVFMSDLGEE